MSDYGKIWEVASLVERFVRKVFPGYESAEVEVTVESRRFGIFGLWTKGPKSMLLGMGTGADDLKTSVLDNFRYIRRGEMNCCPESWEELKLFLESIGAEVEVEDGRTCD